MAGIDIGGTKISVGLVDSAGKVVTQRTMPVQVERGPAEALSRILHSLEEQSEEARAVIAGVGIGCTGPVNPITGEVEDVPTLPGWQGWNPVEAISRALGVTAAMENDADAAALGEWRWGTSKAERSLICITIGTGIGAGIILNGEIYRGANGSHPEPGHHIIDPNGPQCSCGARGCWEAFASGPAMEEFFAAQHGTPISVDAREICARARAGDAAAAMTVEREIRYLGLGLANVVSMYMPEAIVLGGSVMRSADLLLEGVKAVAAENCRLVPYRDCDISLASLGADVGVVGAAQVWRERFHQES